MSEYDSLNGARLVGDMAGVMTLFIWGPIGVFLLIGLFVITPLEIWGKHQCKARLAEMGVEEPAEWPNCHNMDGQTIMKERYPSRPNN